MTILPSVVKAEHAGHYRLHLIFNDGTSKVVDFEPWLEGPMFEALRNHDSFREFFVAGSTVCWPNGADIAPETLYEAADIRQVAQRRSRADGGSHSLAAAGQRERYATFSRRRLGLSVKRTRAPRRASVSIRAWVLNKSMRPPQKVADTRLRHPPDVRNFP